MKAIYCGILISVLFCGCREEKQEKTAEEPAVVEVLTDDAEMNTAIQKAHSSLDTFNLALTSHNPNYDYFALKVFFPSAEGGEHIWLSEISLDKGKYIGVINNAPEVVKDVDVGDTVIIDNGRIGDWMFVEAGKLHGGYTVRLLRNRMTDEEKNNFDRENGLIIEE